MRIGSLFSGYGGLDRAAEEFFDATTAWVSDIDPGACKVLAHRYPDAPNVGDITTVDWSSIEPVDIITGGSPCQDLSHAGKRGGMTEGTRSNLWVAMRDAITTIRPTYVVWENVRGAYSACADSEVGQCPGCMGAGSQHRPFLRALGRVLGDLSDLGYDCRWHGLRAADVGAAHGRFRVFILATIAGSRSVRRSPGWPAGPGEAQGGRPHDHLAGRRFLPTPSAADALGGHLTRSGNRSGELLLERAQLFGDAWQLPTPRATDGTKGGPNQRGSSGDLMLSSAVVQLLPTPAVNDMGAGKTVEAWDEWTAAQKAKHGNGNGHGASLHIEALRLLPTPKREMHTKTSAKARKLYSSGDSMGDVIAADSWGDYADAIGRQEVAFGRPAPAPTEKAPKGGQRLSCRFDEWLMGMPDGWVTDVPGITHNEALKLCGNGVVSQQAYTALREMASWQAITA